VSDKQASSGDVEGPVDLVDRSDPGVGLLRRALDALSARSLDPEDQVQERHQLAVAALHHLGPQAGLALVPPDSLASVAHAAHLWCVASQLADREGMLESAQDWADRAAEKIAEKGRWQAVLPDWVGLDSARADLCAQLVRLGRDRQGSAVAAGLRKGTIAHVRSVAALCRHLPTHDAWDTVAEAVALIRRADERDRAVAALFAEGHPHPRFGAEAGAALQLVDAVVGVRTAVEPHVAAVAGARTAARLARCFLEVPALTAAVDAWGRAVSLAGSTPPGTPGAIQVLGEVTRDQLRKVGAGPAGVTWQTTLERMTDRPLPPDPPQIGPWAVLVELSLAHPELSPALSRIVARHPAVPGSWAHALGRLHLIARRPDRVARVAEVLLQAASRHSEDHESRLMAGLLLARIGDREDEAWESLLLALSAVDSQPDATVWLVGSHGPRRYAECAVDALLAGGSVELALTVARMVGASGLRARLVARCLEGMPAGEGAGLIAEEAALALSDADSGVGAPLLDAALAGLPRVLWAASDLHGATEVLRQLVGRTIEAPLPTFLAAMALLADALKQVGPAAGDFRTPFEEGWERRMDSSAEGSELTELVVARLADC